MQLNVFTAVIASSSLAISNCYPFIYHHSPSFEKRGTNQSTTKCRDIYVPNNSVALSLFIERYGKRAPPFYLSSSFLKTSLVSCPTLVKWTQLSFPPAVKFKHRSSTGASEKPLLWPAQNCASTTMQIFPLSRVHIFGQKNGLMSLRTNATLRVCSSTYALNPIAADGRSRQLMKVSTRSSSYGGGVDLFIIATSVF